MANDTILFLDIQKLKTIISMQIVSILDKNILQLHLGDTKKEKYYNPLGKIMDDVWKINMLGQNDKSGKVWI